MTRIQKERELMGQHFPSFAFFVSGKRVGFQGYVKGSKGWYEVVMESSNYPYEEPKIYMHPRVGHHWYSDGSLCNPRHWNPAKNTFGNLLLDAIEYIRKYG